LWFLFRSTGPEAPGVNPRVEEEAVFFVID